MSDILSGKQLKALEALLSGQPVPAAARAVGVSDRTLRRWKARPAFDAELRARADEALDDTSRRLSLVAANAPLVIQAVMMDRGASSGARIAAARLALEERRKFKELQDFADRLDEIEQRLASL